MDPLKSNTVVSVIVPCYNYGRFLGEALESVMNQTFTNWECIIVDNGSTDNTNEVAKKFIDKDKRFHYFFHENKGVASARNFAIKNSVGKYILPLDADDKIGQNYLKEAVTILERRPSLKIVYCEAMLFGEINRKWNLPDFSIENILMENVVFCSAFFRRSDYDKTNGYNEQMLTGFEDWDFWLELLKNGGEVFKIPQINFYYRIRRESRNSRLAKDQVKMLRKQIYQNHKELYEKYFDISNALFEWYLKKEVLNDIQSSKEFRFGKTILHPLRKLKSLFTSLNS